MATWAVGDLQGCLTSLERLLERVDFEPANDRLWLVGDLVNRGPDSLGVLRRVIGLGAAATVVLGNHDLHLLAVAAGFRRIGRRDTLADVLAAPDRDELLAWLATRAVAHREQVAGRRWLMVHAGLHPRWTGDHALVLADELARALRDERRDALLEDWATGQAPTRWSDSLAGTERLAAIAAWLMLARACTPDGELVMGFSAPPESAPEGALPWWDVPDRASAGELVVCGHWAAAGLRVSRGVHAIDTGCVWGGALTALCLEDGRTESVPSAEAPAR